MLALSIINRATVNGSFNSLAAELSFFHRCRFFASRQWRATLVASHAF